MLISFFLPPLSFFLSFSNSWSAPDPHYCCWIKWMFWYFHFISCISWWDILVDVQFHGFTLRRFMWRYFFGSKYKRKKSFSWSMNNRTDDSVWNLTATMSTFPNKNELFSHRKKKKERKNFIRNSEFANE